MKSSGDLDIWLVLRDLCDSVSIEGGLSSMDLWEQIEVTGHPTGQRR
jgi:hypothetical protein